MNKNITAMLAEGAAIREEGIEKHLTEQLSLTHKSLNALSKKLVTAVNSHAELLEALELLYTNIGVASLKKNEHGIEIR